MQSLRMATCGVLPPNSGNVSPSVRRAFGAASREGLGRKSAPSPTCAQMMGALYGVGKPLRVSVRAQARRHCANRAGSPCPLARSLAVTCPHRLFRVAAGASTPALRKPGWLPLALTDSFVWQALDRPLSTTRGCHLSPQRKLKPKSVSSLSTATFLPPPLCCRHLCAAAWWRQRDVCVCVCVCVCVYQVVRNVKTGSEVTFPCHSCIGPNQQVRRAGRMCA